MKKNTILWIFRQIKYRIFGLVLLTAANASQAFFAVLFALGSRGVIDSATSGDVSTFYTACLWQGAIICGILLSLTLNRHLKDRLTADLERDWKKHLLHGLLHGDYAQIRQYHSAELLNRMNNDVTKVNEGILTIVPSLASMLTRLGAAVVVLGILDARFTLVIAAVGLAVVLGTAVMRRKLKDLNKLVSTHDGRVSGFLQETMEKLLMVQSMDVSEEVENRASVFLDDRYAIQKKRKNVSLAANTGISIMSYGAGFLALCWCAWKLLHGQMSFGSLTAVIQLVNQIQTPFVNLSGVLPRYAAMMASAERLMELEQIQGQPTPMVEDRDEVYSRMQAITGENLTFSYDRDKVLDCADIRIPKGSFAAITGPSGIGKSTLLKLLLGVYTPSEGQLYLDCGEGSIPLDRSSRRLFAYVPQENLLLSGTLRDNLTIVKPDATAEEIEKAIYVSCMDAYLPQLPQGLDTPLGEGGFGLSEGQAQRLAIARAILGGAPILLLDECTSALDEETERTVLQRIRAMQNFTCLAVTHRPAAKEICDLNLQLKDGKFVAVS